jgi:hypothetical protein
VLCNAFQELRGTPPVFFSFRVRIDGLDVVNGEFDLLRLGVEITDLAHQLIDRGFEFFHRSWCRTRLPSRAQVSLFRLKLDPLFCGFGVDWFACR